MSHLSGKCDLLDTICMEKHRNKEGKEVQFGDPGVNVYYSDIMECFKIFKEKTGGILHQHIHVDANANTRDLIVKKCNQFSYRFETQQVQTKNGPKDKEVCIYTYYGEDYTEKELKKHGGVYIDDPIKFNNILELVPYFPYLVTMSYSNKDERIVYISNDSFAEEEHRSHLRCGYDSRMIDYYRKELAQTYFEICRDYLCYKLEERIKIIKLDYNKLIKTEDDYRLTIPEGIDEEHPVRYIFYGDDMTTRVGYSHWSAPKMVDKNTVSLSKLDMEELLKDHVKNGKVAIEYVEYVDFPLQLG